MASLFEEGLFVEQTENASEASAARGKPAAATGEGDDGGEGVERCSLSTKGSGVHCLSSDRNTIFFRERLRRATATEGPLPPPPRCSLSQSHFDSR